MTMQPASLTQQAASPGLLERALSPRLLMVIIPVVTICLGAAIYFLIQNTIDRAVRDDAGNAAHSWASYFARNITGLEQLLESGKPTPEQVAFVKSSQQVGEVFRFKLFDKQGRLILISDEAEKAAAQETSLRDHNADAARALSLGEDVIHVEENHDNPKRPPLYAEAYVPVPGQDGKPVGIVEVYVDQTATKQLFDHEFFGLGLSLSGLMMAAFLVPALAFAHRNTQTMRVSAAAAETAMSARLAAEEHARDVEAINSKMADLNGDLADNLKRLREAQDELLRKSKLSQLGQLTATVAHELRNPLGAVRTSAFLLERKVKDKGLGVEAQLSRISNGITRCDNIISQLLDFARTKALSPEVLGFDDWLEKQLDEEVQRLPEMVQVMFSPGLDGVPVRFDPGRMGRVLINLISNASEAMVGKGEAVNKPMSYVPTIDVATRMTARGIEVSITDNGPGMTQEVLNRILEPLFTTKSFGTGLGLPAVEKILQDHGGGLDIASAEGKGSTFTAWFPQAADLRQVA